MANDSIAISRNRNPYSSVKYNWNMQNMYQRLKQHNQDIIHWRYHYQSKVTLGQQKRIDIMTDILLFLLFYVFFHQWDYVRLLMLLLHKRVPICIKHHRSHQRIIRSMDFYNKVVVVVDLIVVLFRRYHYRTEPIYAGIIGTRNWRCWNMKKKMDADCIVLPHNQCDQFGQFIGLWAIFESLWQQ